MCFFDCLIEGLPVVDERLIWHVKLDAIDDGCGPCIDRGRERVKIALMGLRIVDSDEVKVEKELVVWFSLDLLKELVLVARAVVEVLKKEHRLVRVLRRICSELLLFFDKKKRI